MIRIKLINFFAGCFFLIVNSANARELVLSCHGIEDDSVMTIYKEEDHLLQSDLRANYSLEGYIDISNQRIVFSPPIHLKKPHFLDFQMIQESAIFSSLSIFGKGGNAMTAKLELHENRGNEIHHYLDCARQ